ncbi:hypothetical protein DFS34DRAFT_578968 [Phlyctochytrium arcticum]|nr:hypothetical protein DFS34DRAFT_578968 [Phlyctochytrium arcticum]
MDEQEDTKANEKAASDNHDTNPPAHTPPAKPHEEQQPTKKKHNHNHKVKNVDFSDNTLVQIMSTLPHSSVWCQGTNRTTRICRFRNICYNPMYGQWFILRTNASVQDNVPLRRYEDGLLELTTVQNHASYRFNFVEVDPLNVKFQNVSVRYETDYHFAISRIHPNNIMHNLHDDVLGLYHTMKQYIGGGQEDQNLPFDIDSNRILFMDGYGATQSTPPFQFLTAKKLRFRQYMEQDFNTFTCYRDLVAGNAKLTTWYQYGFEEPQGPIKDKATNGRHVREVTEWLTRRMGLPLTGDEDYGKVIASKHNELLGQPPATAVEPIPDPKDDLFILFVRRRNRLILNEETLIQKLEEQFKLPVQIVSNEDHSFEQQVAFMRRARVVMAMHGSILVMTMFCRRNTVVVELYPFGIPSENYTPYRTLANLPGMGLIYRAWESTNETAAIAYPDRHPLWGGIDTFSPEKQELIRNTKRVPIHKCCDNPFWLYRIYQDTHVDIAEVSTLIQDGLDEASRVRKEMAETAWHASPLLPPPVSKVECMNGDQRQPGTLWVKWSPPWTGAQVDKWMILVLGKDQNREFMTTDATTVTAIPGFEPGETIEFRVRPLVGSWSGEYGATGSCQV